MKSEAKKKDGEIELVSWLGDVRGRHGNEAQAASPSPSLDGIRPRPHSFDRIDDRTPPHCRRQPPRRVLQACNTGRRSGPYCRSYNNYHQNTRNRSPPPKEPSPGEPPPHSNHKNHHGNNRYSGNSSGSLTEGRETAVSPHPINRPYPVTNACLQVPNYRALTVDI